jgi:hypothetical protein
MEAVVISILLYCGGSCDGYITVEVVVMRILLYVPYLYYHGAKTSRSVCPLTLFAYGLLLGFFAEKQCPV